MCAWAISRCLTTGSLGGNFAVALGRRELEASALSKGLPDGAEKAAVPHQCGIERGVHHRGCASLIARALAPGTDDQIVLHADGDRLRVAEACTWRMAAGAGVVVVQSADGSKKSCDPDRRACRSVGATEARYERRFDATGEARLLQNGFQNRIELRIDDGVIVGAHRPGGPECSDRHRAANHSAFEHCRSACPRHCCAVNGVHTDEIFGSCHDCSHVTWAASIAAEWFQDRPSSVAFESTSGP